MRNYLKLSLTLGLILLTITTSLYLRSCGKSDYIVTIYPDSGPYKIKKTQDKQNRASIAGETIYNHLKSQTPRKEKVNLLPKPEQPIYIKQNLDREYDPISNIINSLEVKNPDFSIKKNHINNTESLKIIEQSLAKETSKRNTPRNYSLQIAVLRSKDQAEEAWDRIRNQNFKLLSKYEFSVYRASSINQKSMYYLLVGNFSNFYEAENICRKLNANKQSCIVHRN